MGKSGIEAMKALLEEEERLTDALHQVVRSEHETGPRDLTSIYLMFSNLGECLYVGITNDAIGRLAEHAYRSWYQDISEVRYEHYRIRKVAEIRERWLIYQYGPVHNKARHHPFPNNRETWDTLLDHRHGFPPRWPLLEGYNIPQTSAERTLEVPVDTHAGELLYDRDARSAMRMELSNAEGEGRVVRAARAIASDLQYRDRMHVREVFDLVDDYPFVAVAGMHLLLGDTGPLVRMGPVLAERKKAAHAQLYPK